MTRSGGVVTRKWCDDEGPGDCRGEEWRREALHVFLEHADSRMEPGDERHQEVSRTSAGDVGVTRLARLCAASSADITEGQVGTGSRRV